MVGGSATRGGGGGGVGCGGYGNDKGNRRGGKVGGGSEGGGEGVVECCTIVLQAVSKHICCYGILVNTMTWMRGSSSISWKGQQRSESGREEVRDEEGVGEGV